MNCVIIESPFSAITEMEKKANITFARQAMRDSLMRGEAPFPSHLLYPQVLNDDIYVERDRGMRAGWEWLVRADRVVVYRDRGVSLGMQQGMDLAQKLGKPIEMRWIGPNPTSWR